MPEDGHEEDTVQSRDIHDWKPDVAASLISPLHCIRQFNLASRRFRAGADLYATGPKELRSVSIVYVTERRPQASSPQGQLRQPVPC